MRIKWKDRLDLSPTLANIEKWPSIDIRALPKEKRKGYLFNLKIVSKALSGEHTLETIANENNTTRSRISKLLNKCLGGKVEDEPLLSKGLIPYRRSKRGKRITPLPTIENPSGANFAFRRLLDEVPGLVDRLDGLIKAEISDKKYKQNLRAEWVHEFFIKCLENAHWPTNTYPYTETSLGYEALRRYYVERKAYLLQNKSRSLPRRKISSTLMKTAFMEEVQLDEQVYDLFSSVHIDMDGDMKPIPLARVSLVLARDVATTAILAYILSLGKTPSHDDILNCLHDIRKCWEPKTLLTPGLEYTPGSGLPSAIVPQARCVMMGELKLDNAFVHKSNIVRNHLTQTECCTFNLGLPANPLSRNWIEYAFKLANEYSHRFASTTGSHSQDPKRQSRKNAKQSAIVSLRILEECLDVVLAHFNIEPKSHLGGLSPVDLIRYQVENIPLPMHFENTLCKLTSNDQSEIVTVRWDSISRGLPHINFYKVKYKSRDIPPIYINKKINIIFDRDDIRLIKAYSLEGSYLGEFRAPRSWIRFKHSLKTRRKINKYTEKIKKTIRDPLTSYFYYLYDNRKSPELALELVRVYREFSITSLSGLKPELNDPVEIQGEENAISDEEMEMFPEWGPHFLNTRES